MRAALLSVPGVRNAEVSFDDELARVEYDADRATVADMVAAVEATGYKAWDTRTEKHRAGPGDAGPGDAGPGR